jgi:hypothetical protein
MLQFLYNNKEVVLDPIVSAEYNSSQQRVIVSQSYSGVTFLKLRIDMGTKAYPIRHEEYTFIRDFYWQLCDQLYTPEIKFVKHSSDAYSFFSIQFPRHLSFIYSLDALFRVERNFNFSSPSANAIIMKRFLHFIRDGLNTLEKYYGSLPF